MLPRRRERINELLHRELSRLVMTLKDPRIGFLTITGVEVTDDLSLARVYYSVLGTAQEKQVTGQVLEDSVPYLRKFIGKLESLFRVPSLQFIYDDTPERATRVFTLLEQIRLETKKTREPKHEER